MPEAWRVWVALALAAVVVTDAGWLAWRERSAAGLMLAAVLVLAVAAVAGAVLVVGR